jgi:hypothetical protein
MAADLRPSVGIGSEQRSIHRKHATSKIEVIVMNIVSTSCIQRGRITFGAARAGLAALGLMGLCSPAFAAEKPPVAPDTLAPFTTDSRISATIEFGLPVLAGGIFPLGSPPSTSA